MTGQLDLATDILDGRVSIGGNSVRAAAWVARTALEDVLADLLRAKGCVPGRAGTRSVLSCIEILYATEAPRVPQLCEYAWQGLSRACHHHAFELAPTHAEVAALVQTVRDLRTADLQGGGMHREYQAQSRTGST